MELSVLLPFSVMKPEQLMPYAGMVEWTGVHRLWEGQSLTVEPHQAFSYLAGTGSRPALGIGVTLMPFRHPFDAAVQAASLARMSGPLVVGYGPGSRNLQQMLRGEPYRSPLTAAREYVDLVRDLVRGRSVEHQGEYFTCRGALTAGPTPSIEVGLGVLRPGMARLAGEVADAAITWLTPASYLRDTVAPAIRAGAESRGQVPRLVAIVPVGLVRPGRDAAELANASNRTHLSSAHYRDMLSQAGIDLSSAGTPMEAAQAAVDGGAFLSGDIDDVLAGLKEYEEAGVDELVLNLTGVYHKSGPDRARKELELLLRAASVL